MQPIPKGAGNSRGDRWARVVGRMVGRGEDALLFGLGWVGLEGWRVLLWSVGFLSSRATELIACWLATLLRCKEPKRDTEPRKGTPTARDPFLARDRPIARSRQAQHLRPRRRLPLDPRGPGDVWNPHQGRAWAERPWATARRRVVPVFLRPSPPKEEGDPTRIRGFGSQRLFEGEKTSSLLPCP